MEFAAGSGWCMNHFLHYEMKLCVIKSCRLTNEQRSAVAEYFRVYKVVFSRVKLWFFCWFLAFWNSLSLIIVYVTQGNENNTRKVALMGFSLHLFLAYGFLHHLCLSDFKITISATNIIWDFQEIVCGFSQGFL